MQKINFVGNHAFSNRQLDAIIKTSATTMLSFFTGGDVYDPDRINDDREQIRTYYRSHGYADAGVPTRTPNTIRQQRDLSSRSPSTKASLTASARSTSSATCRASIRKSCAALCW